MVQCGNLFQKLLLLHYLIWNLMHYCNILRYQNETVLIDEKLNFAPDDLKTVNLANKRACPKKKLRRQILQADKISKNDKLLEKESHLYVPGGGGGGVNIFQYIQRYVMSFQSLVVSIINNCVTFFPFCSFFSRNCFF